MADPHDERESLVIEDASVTFTFETRERFPSLKELTTAAEDLADLVTAVAADMELSLRDANQWAVSGLRVGSAVLTVAPQVPIEEIGGAHQVVGAILDGLRLLDAGTDQRPAHFNDAALEAAKHMTGLLNNGFTRILVRGPAVQQFELTQRVQATVDAFIRGVAEVLGSVEGRLESVNVHDGRRFVIYQSGTGKRVECRFPADMTRQVLENFDRRVQVMGLVKYTRRGEPSQIAVQRVRRLRDHDETPSVADLAGIDPSFTGGLSPEDYLERLRDGS